MPDFSSFVPAHIRKLVKSSRSKPLKQSENSTKPIALNLNENPFGPSPLALRAMESVLTESHRYPAIDATGLQEELAAFNDVQPEQVLVTAGATELLCIIARVLLGPGLNAITSARSFIVYKLATQVTQGKLIELPTCDNGYDLAAISGAIDDNTRIIFVSNPNNPTGTLLPAEEMDRFVKKLPGHVLLVLDEAYGDFAVDFARQRRVEYSRVMDYIRADRNVILLKTFSKAHGLAGLRVGYGIGPTNLMSALAQARSVFSISSVAHAAARAALHDQEHIAQAVKNNSEQAQVLISNLKEVGLAVASTWANFVYCELEEDAAEFADRLLSRGVLVQPLATWGAPRAVRISIGTPEQNAHLIEALREILRKTKRP